MKLGRLPVRHTPASFMRSHIMTRALNALGTPPSTSPDWVSAVMKIAGTWLMFGNDQFGDCVIADCGHQEMLRTANVGDYFGPTDAEVLALYAYFQGMKIDPSQPLTPAGLNAVSTYLARNDNGCNELDVITYLSKVGWLGRKLDGSANLDPTQLDQIKWAVCIFGASRLGINLPDSAQSQFADGEPWSPVAGAQLDGGHDVPVVKYDGTYFYVVTWGKLQPVTEAFMTAKYPDGTPYVEEAHAELAFDWVNAAGTCPANLDLTKLVADLTAIVEPEPTPSPVPPSPPPSPAPVTMSPHELANLMELAINSCLVNPKNTTQDMLDAISVVMKQA